MGFRDKLANNAASGPQGDGKLKVINMQSKNNYGSIVFIPFNPKDGSDSVAVLNDVMEVKYHQKYQDKKTKETKSMSTWLRLLNREDYPDLNQEELDEYKDLRAMGKKLSGHKFSKSKTEDRNMRNERIRFKNYTLLVGWVIEHTDLQKKVINKNIPAILVFSSKGFDEAFNNALKAKDEINQSTEWMVKLFNSQNVRKKYLSIKYRLRDKDDKKVGYESTVSIGDFNEETIRYTGGKEGPLEFTEDQMNALKEIPNPINAFLGRSGRPYNAKEVEKMRNRLHELLNKYCGCNYELPDGKVVEHEEVHDPLGDVKKDPTELPPTDEEHHAKKGNDAWDD